MPDRFRLAATLVLLLAAGAFLAPPAVALEPDESAAVPSDRLTAADVLDFEQVSDPRISPDGRQIVYTRRWVDRVDDEWRSALWIMDADGSRNRFLTEGSAARWSPDGERLLYLAEGEPRGQQVFVRWMDGAGGATQVTRVLETPHDPEWSPDGSSIAFVMLVAADEEWEIEMPPPPEDAEWTAPPRVVRQAHYRQDRVGFMETGFTHLFVVPADGGTPRQLTRGDWNVGARFDGLFFGASFDWAPDGRTLVFDGLRDAPVGERYLRSHLYAVDVAGDGAVRQLTRRPGYWAAPAVAPDGRQVAFVGFDASGDTYQMERLQVMALDGSGQRTLATELDREPRSLHWAPDGSGVWFQAEDRGSVNVHFATLGGAVSPVTEGTHVLTLSSLSADPRATAVGLRSDPDEPPDVVRYSLADGVPRRLTTVNADLLAGRRLAEVEELWVESSGGARIQGWLVEPPDFDPSERHPLVLEIHGGPFAMYTVGFNLNFQVMAAADHPVLYVNPRGSTGYGEDFSKAIDFAYPGVDYDDLMAAVDAVVARGWVDTSRLYVGGCSGGGVLTSWVIAHTDRFAAASVRCPVTNWISMAGTTDIPYFTHSFFRAPFWEDPESWFRQSSLMHVGQVTTPTLVMTGELDVRTPMPQSEEYFVALQMRGVESVLLRFADEYHGTGSKPSNQMRTLLYMLDWYRDHRRPEAPTTPALEPATSAAAPSPSGGPHRGR